MPGGGGTGGRGPSCWRTEALERHWEKRDRGRSTMNLTLRLRLVYIYIYVIGAGGELGSVPPPESITNLGLETFAGAAAGPETEHVGCGDSSKGGGAVQPSKASETRAEAEPLETQLWELGSVPPPESITSLGLETFAGAAASPETEHVGCGDSSKGGGAVQPSKASETRAEAEPLETQPWKLGSVPPPQSITSLGLETFAGAVAGPETEYVGCGDSSKGGEAVQPSKASETIAEAEPLETQPFVLSEALPVVPAKLAHWIRKGEYVERRSCLKIMWRWSGEDLQQEIMGWQG